MLETIYKQSLTSFNLLKNIVEEVKLGDNNEIIIDNMIMLDDEEYKMLLFNTDSKKFRRKRKSEYKYLNFFSNCSKLVDYFLAEYSDIEAINMECKEDSVILSLRNITNNKNVYKKEYRRDKDLPLDYYIATYIKEYLDGLSH